MRKLFKSITLITLTSITTIIPVDTTQKTQPLTTTITNTAIPVNDQDMSFEIYTPAQQHSKIKCLMLIIGQHPLIEKIAPLLQFDLEFSDQLDIDIKRNQTELDTKILSKLFDQGISLCLYIKQQNSKAKNTKSVDLQVLLKEPTSGDTLFSKTIHYQNDNVVHQTHRLSDELMPLLSGNKGPMLSTLAYCKQLSPRHKVVCVADYACKIEKTVVPTKTINVAPAWHTHVPCLFYSQFSRSNSRLMSLDLKTRQPKVICSYDGLNMQPSFSPDGTKAVLCLSGKGNAEIYLYDQILCNKLKRRVFKPLTNNKGNNVSPCYLPDGNVIFCSDYQTKFPQIYMMDMKTKKTHRLTNGRGYCAAPSYCAKTKSIVYTRYIKGNFQLFTMSLQDPNHKERQLTITAGDKLDPSYSECGQYVAFTYTFLDKKSQKMSNQIAVFNQISGKIRVLTSTKEPKSFPAWTGRMLY